MKFYTKKGDSGKTYCLKYLEYIPKNHPFIEFIGTLDEAEAAIGFASTLIPRELSRLKDELDWMQSLLFRIGFTVSGKKCIDESDLASLESITDYYSKYVKGQFTLNGGHPASAAVSLARSIVRRAERKLVDLIDRKEPIGEEKLVLSLINRLSSALYAIQLAINELTGSVTHPVKCENESENYER
ncbi:MAG: cob(I)yrinic acid a,c-diamide adenosyltransferase [Thermoprotei archaeon]|nr:cob(I)yrinic acid a,c-diamide adenosyltransferase [Thermoprotei archaeon]